MTVTPERTMTATLPLHTWFYETLQDAGVASPADAVLAPEAVADLLELARRSAHCVCRPAAPLATFAAGVALGRAGGELDELKAIIRRIVMAVS
jgi:hypothetical protein